MRFEGSNRMEHNPPRTAIPPSSSTPRTADLSPPAPPLQPPPRSPSMRLQCRATARALGHLGLKPPPVVLHSTPLQRRAAASSVSTGVCGCRASELRNTLASLAHHMTLIHLVPLQGSAPA
jgi:hypothetical protein